MTELSLLFIPERISELAVNANLIYKEKPI